MYHPFIILKKFTTGPFEVNIFTYTYTLPILTILVFKTPKDLMDQYLKTAINLYTKYAKRLSGAL